MKVTAVVNYRDERRVGVGEITFIHVGALRWQLSKCIGYVSPSPSPPGGGESASLEVSKLINSNSAFLERIVRSGRNETSIFDRLTHETCNFRAVILDCRAENNANVSQRLFRANKARFDFGASLSFPGRGRTAIRIRFCNSLNRSSCLES